MTRESSSTCDPGAVRTTDAASCFSAPVADHIMYDAQMEPLLAAASRLQGAFSAVERFPWLHEVLAERSRTFLEQHGEERWQTVGGCIDNMLGVETFQKTSSIAGAIIKRIAGESGGIRYQDEAGRPWAVRLLPNHRDPSGNSYLGYAIGGYESPATMEATIGGQANALRASCSGPHGMRFSGALTQAYWLIYYLVRMQRRSVVVLPDVMFAQCIWGGHQKPPNWRKRLFDILTTLHNIRLEVLTLGAQGWDPHVSFRSVALASIGDQGRSGRRLCDIPLCPLQGSNLVHGHFDVEISRGFLGVLENYVSDVQEDCRTYDFDSPRNDEAKERLRQAKQAGRLISGSFTANLFGAATWSGVSNKQREIIDGLMREVTRARGQSPKNDCDDNAEVLDGNSVPGRTSKQTVTCPLLDSTQSYVAFGGNRTRRGLGYTIIGRTGNGWLTKLGYGVPAERRDLVRVQKDLLEDLAGLGDVMGLIAVGYYHRDGSWFTLEDMIQLARSEAGRRQLDRLWLRFYAPANYPDLLRRWIEDRGAMTIPHPGQAPQDLMGQDLLLNIQSLGMTQMQLANQLECSQSFVSKVLRGHARCPDRMREQIHQLVAQTPTPNS